jgi:uncharacterized protein (DUF1501 family)
MSKYTPTLHTRREFVRRGLGFAAASMTIPAWLDRSVLGANGQDGRILVVLQLSGGNDGLNTVIPYANDDYHRARPVLRFTADKVLKINDSIGLNPGLAPLKALYDNGHAAIIQGVGYPNPNRSHFRSMEIWHTCSDSDKFEKYGWIGRYFDNECTGSGSPASGVALGNETPQAFANKSGRGITFASPEAFRFRPDVKAQKVAEAEVAAYRALNSVAPDKADFLTRTAMNAQLTSDRVRAIASSYKAKAEYPQTPLATDLRHIAGMIAGNLGSRIYYAQAGGFDTHTGQLERHARLMANVAGSLGAFHKDLTAQGLADRVLILTFSEFGRRLVENASAGTDHGVAGPIFVIGNGVKPGLIGSYPSLTDLDQGDLKASTDFRQVYATVLERWLGAKSEPILGRRFEQLAFI